MSTNPMCSNAAAIAALNALTALLNSGSITIYTGSMPATCETASSGTLLSSGCTFGSTAFGTATDGSDGTAHAVANSIGSDTNAAATGTAGYFRAYKSDGTTCVLQGTVGTSSADMIVNSTSIVSGGVVAVTSFTLKLPDGSGSD